MNANPDFNVLLDDISNVCPHCNTDDCEIVHHNLANNDYTIVAFWCQACGTLITKEATLKTYDELSQPSASATGDENK